ncbi:MAG: thiosulfate/3-mercaptopyruvate sulfurtransferase [Myxococcota bacterium]|jgi:thiosulfate/3-mercaptopyruvate sulfurtransferase
MTTPLISAAALAAELDNVCVLDARLTPDAAKAFAAEHVRGARFVDGGRELSDPTVLPEVGGRHPFPPPEAFIARIVGWGIDRDTPVVVYDDQGGRLAAARAWWMLRAVGVRSVRVLDGGLQAAAALGLTEAGSTSGSRQPATPWPAASWPGVVDIAGVRQALAAGRPVLDARPGARFRGEEEHYDPVAGHMPGATSAPCAANLSADNTFRSPAELRAHYAPLVAAGPPIVSCGSGITACHDALAMAVAGLPSPELFVGSWSLWSRTGGAVATG